MNNVMMIVITVSSPWIFLLSLSTKRYFLKVRRFSSDLKRPFSDDAAM